MKKLLQWNTPATNIKQLLQACHNTKRFSAAKKSMVKIVLASLVYYVWKARNEVLWNQRQWHINTTTALAGIEEVAQRPIHSSRCPFFSRYLLLLLVHSNAYLNICLQCLSPQPFPPSPFKSVFPSSVVLMASSSRNPIPLTALDDEESLVHDFDHISLHSPTDSNSVKPSWIEKAMIEAWTLRFSVQISEYHSGLFLASFQCHGDCRCVLEEQPWHFDKFLMAHRILFGRKSPQLAQFIADEIGELIEIFPLSLLENFGPYLRLRVLFDITKPLRRGMTIRFRGINDPKWVSFKYESLPNFCYFCGLVDHTYNKCTKYLLRCDNFPVPPALEYKESLRATTSAQHKRNPFELSNSIPYEEYFPRIRTDDQSLQQDVDQFLSQGVCEMAINSILQGISPRLCPEQSAFLDGNFTEAEIKQALFSLSGDKAPGPDGLNPLFYHKNWSIFGSDLCHAMLHILNHQGDISLINDTILVLIPKKKNPKTGCQITDNILIANEIIHAIHSRRSGKLGWAAISSTRKRLLIELNGNSFIICSLMLVFLHFYLSYHEMPSTVIYRLSLNGILSDPFRSSRGIRQGDPLSPYLFLLVDKGLSAAIRLHEANGSFAGIQICRGAPSLSHLLFADDSMLFSPVTPHSSEALNAILLLYNQATGQLVNRDKSSILFSPNTSTESQHEFSSSLHLTGEGFISKYLGVPHCVGRVTNSVFHYLIQSVSPHLMFGMINFFPELAPNGYNSSFTWKSLLWGRQLLKKGLVWKRGAGINIPLSAPNWIPGISHPTIMQPIDPFHAFVSFFINPDITWNVLKLKHYFPSYQDYNEAQQNNLDDHWVSVSNQRTHHSQLFPIDDFQEDSPTLYVDAALDHNHVLTGIGFTFKIGHHQIVASKNRRLLGASTPIFAEGQALLQGLSWCIDSQLQPEFIFSDYLNLVSNVKGNWQDHSVLSGLVSQIKLFFSNFPEASLKYLPRQFNTAAHRLAKDAIRLREEGHEELI
uniref:Reverse transcriptase domain-containing protein n=1 Tax=Cannabis sativa TaxID=3483 RepID=A0A803PZ99_CANSA